jgi:hypothetical protein
MRELPYELKYNCLRHLNDELLRRLAEANQIIAQFKAELNGRSQEEAISCEQEGSSVSDGLCLECGGENEEESVRETATSEKTQDDQRAMREKVWENYVETNY